MNTAEDADRERRRCIRCGLEQDLQRAFRRTRRQGGYRRTCQRCTNADRRAVYAAQRRQRCARARARYAARRSEIRVVRNAQYAAQVCLRRAQEHQRVAAVRTRFVIDGVCGLYSHVPRAAILGAGRAAEVIPPRFLMMALLRNRARLSYAEIGVALGRDHSTVMHGVRTVRLWRQRVYSSPQSDEAQHYRLYQQACDAYYAAFRDPRTGRYHTHPRVPPASAIAGVTAEPSPPASIQTYWRMRARADERGQPGMVQVRLRQWGHVRAGSGR